MAVAHVLALLLVWQPPSETRVVFVGTLHDQRETDEHAYGNVLELWRDGDRLVGRWSRAAGPPADLPTAELVGVAFHESSGRLDFAMRWCGRSERFVGTLESELVAGRVLDDAGRERERVTLVRDSKDVREPLPHDDWQRDWEEALRRRRPRCD